MICGNKKLTLSLLALLFALALVVNFSFTPSHAAPPPPPTAFTVGGFGDNSVGQLTIPAGLTGVTAMDAGELHSLALKSDGTVVGWGDDIFGQATPPAGLSGVTAISAGPGHSLALKNDGTVVGWGSNSDGATTIPAGLNNVTAISAGGNLASSEGFSLALKSDGTVVGWGVDNFGQATPPAGLSGVIAISTGAVHSLALKSDGTVVGWGDDSVGQATPPAGLSGVIAISAGVLHSLALKSDGTVTVVGWGDNTFACEATPPSCVSNPVRISAGFAHSLVMQQNSCIQIGCPVTNTAPVVTITGPASGSIFAVNTPVNFTGTFTDDVGDTHTALWTIGNATQAATVVEPSGSTPGSADTTFTFTEAGVYNVSLTVTDNGNLSGVATTVGEFEALVVIYDPSAGWVTGGGWINSPAGAYTPMPLLTGKANFGFVSKYQNGASVPTGNTEFHFKAGNLKFQSTIYEWMVISGGKKAQYKGVGTINGGGNYRFMLTCVDGDQPGGGGADKFRIRIWSDGGGLVYDNQLNAPDSDDPTTTLGGGSIVIHH